MCLHLFGTSHHNLKTDEVAWLVWHLHLSQREKTISTHTDMPQNHIQKELEVKPPQVSHSREDTLLVVHIYHVPTYGHQ